MSQVPFISQIANNGVLGTILALSLLLNWYFIKAIQRLNDKRVQEMQEAASKSLEPINAIKQNSDLLITLFTRFLNTGGTISK